MEQQEDSPSLSLDTGSEEYSLMIIINIKGEIYNRTNNGVNNSFWTPGLEASSKVSGSFRLMIGGIRKTKLLKIMAVNGIIQSEKGIEKTKIGATAEPMHPKAL